MVYDIATTFEKVDFPSALSANRKRKLIVDNDCGVDDAWGLSLLIKASHEHQVLALTCVKGNTDLDNVCKNNIYLLSVMEKTEIPVYRGASGPLIGLHQDSTLEDDLQFFHGKNGFGDVPLPELKSKIKLEEENAINALNRITSENKGEITLVCFAPLTNIALAIRTYPDFADNVKDVFIMGGNYLGVGNTTSCAEFNFHADPEAAHIVLKEMKNKINLLPWETCMDSKISFEWRESLLNDCGTIVKFLNSIEGPILERIRKLGYTTYISADQLLAAVIINPKIVKKAFKTHALVELTGVYTRGQVVLDHLKSKPSECLVVISQVDSEEYKKIVYSIKNA